MLFISSFSKPLEIKPYLLEPPEQSLSYQMHNLIADLCLLLSVTITNSGFVWKYKRPYDRKFQNDATINQIIFKLETLTQEGFVLVS